MRRMVRCGEGGEHPKRGGHQRGNMCNVISVEKNIHLHTPSTHVTENTRQTLHSISSKCIICWARSDVYMYIYICLRSRINKANGSKTATDRIWNGWKWRHQVELGLHGRMHFNASWT